MVEPYAPAPFQEFREPLAKGPAVPAMRQFTTGATRNTDTEKLDYEGFLSPQVLQSYARYMHTHRRQADGTLRSADNWQKGIPLDVYMTSAWRHFMDVWSLHRGLPVSSPEDGHAVTPEEALNALLFNVQGMLFETLRGEQKWTTTHSSSSS